MEYIESLLWLALWPLIIFLGYKFAVLNLRHYQKMERAGAPMGSGAVESLGKQFQRRLRGCGQFWTRPGLTDLLCLCVLVKNKDDPLLWN